MSLVIDVVSTGTSRVVVRFTSVVQDDSSLVISMSSEVDHGPPALKVSGFHGHRRAGPLEKACEAGGAAAVDVHGIAEVSAQMMHAGQERTTTVSELSSHCFVHALHTSGEPSTLPSGFCWRSGPSEARGEPRAFCSSLEMGSGALTNQESHGA